MTDRRFYHIRPMYEKSEDCYGCPLETLSTGFLMPEGTGVSRLLILGEGGGANEAKDGLPFRPYAQAGAVLERVFKRVGTTREAHVLYNICNCTPPNNELSGAPYELGAALHCRVHLRRVIEQYKPKAILALGAVALRSLTGMTGKKQALENLRGFALSSPEFPDLPIIASYHPSHIARGASHVFPVLCRDLRYAMDIAANGFHPPEVDFYEHAGPSEMRWIMEECSTGEQAGVLPISIDFETEVNMNVFEDVQLMNALEDLYGDEAGKKKKKQRIGTNQPITQINVSIYENQSFVFEASPQNMLLTRELLSLPNPKLTYNGWCFDEPVAAFNDLPFEWPHVDLMWCLRGDNLIPLWGGGREQIKNIVNQRLDCTIIGMNDDGKPIPLAIIGWHKHRVPGQSWLRIKSEACKNSIVVTPEHQVWTTERGFVRADSLFTGEHLRIPRLFNDDVFAGMMLGDAYLNRKNKALYCIHGERQQEYVKAKAACFGAEVHSFTHKKGKNKGRTHYQFCVSSSRDYHDLYYSGKRRVFIEPPSFASLAIWYQDDGCFSRNKRNGSAYGNGRVLLAVNRFASQLDEVKAYFVRQFGTDVELIRDGKILRISKNSLRLFFQAIHELVHPSMEYKLPEEFRGKYNGWMQPTGFATSRVIEISEVVRNTNMDYDTRYCLSVDHPTQRFFAMGGLVHNCFHHLWPDLPGKRGKVQGEQEGSLANLQFAASMYGWYMPWKHLVDEQPEVYGCHDSASVLMLYYALRRDMEKLRYGTTGPTLWDGFISMVYEVQPILANMKQRGIPVVKTKMLEFLKSVVLRQRDVNELIQKAVPDDLRVSHPKEGYKRQEQPTLDCEECGGAGEIDEDQCEFCNGLGKLPNDAVVRRAFHLDAEYKRCRCNRLRKKELDKWEKVPGAAWEPKNPKKPDIDLRLRAPDPECPECGGVGWFDLPERVEERWCKLLPFNVASVPQMKSYAAYRHHKIPKNSKGEIAMDKETVLKLAKKTGDPLYRHTISYREFDKMRVYALGWMPGDDQRIHPTTSFFPATGQFSMTDPNAQTAPNIGKYGALAIEFRSAIEARDGHVLMEFDKKSCHAQTLGFEAGDKSYIRLAKIDIHSYLATRMIKAEHCEYALEWEDGELKDWLKWYRKNYTLKDGTPFQTIRDKQAKPGILGYGFGLGAGKLYRLNEESFENEREARYVLDTLDATFPLVKQYRDRIPLTAKKQGGKLISRYGFVRWFWDIQKWDFSKREWVHGDDWERAIAFLPANDAFGDMRAIMKRMEENGMCERYGLMLNVHDALAFEVPCKKQEQAYHEIKEEMEKPSEVLLFEDGNGLQVEVEGKVGKRWSELKEV